MRTSNRRPLVFTSATLALVLALAGSAREAEARGRHWRLRAAPVLGAVIAGAVLAEAVAEASVHARVVLPPVSVEVHTHPGYPPPPPPPPPVYYPPPPPVYAPPAPAVVYRAHHPRPDFPRLGLSLAGTYQAAWADQTPIAGAALALHVRTSSHSQLGLELQSLGTRRPLDGSRRDDLAALVAGRVFLWNAALAPYLELAGGIGRASVEADVLEVHASQLLGRFGVGLELRLGRHIVLDGQIAQLHRVRLDEDDYRGPLGTDRLFIDNHERATEIRGGVGLRF